MIWYNQANVSGVTGPLSVTVLQNVITPKFLHKKFIQKYEWIEHISIYHHSKFEVEQKLVQEETKKDREKFAYEQLRIADHP